MKSVKYLLQIGGGNPIFSPEIMKWARAYRDKCGIIEFPEQDRDFIFLALNSTLKKT